MGPAAEINFNHHFGLNPDRLADTSLLDGNDFERCLGRLQGFELAKKRARDLVGETGSSASCIAQLVSVIEAKHEGAYGTRICGRGNNPSDNQLLTVRAFGLDPVVSAPRTIWCVSNLRHDTLQAHFAGVTKQRCAGIGERFTQAEWPPRGLP